MAHATSDSPAWLWSADATRILWANPTGAAIFGSASPAAVAGHTIDPKGSAALQIARLAGTLPHGAAPRLERLRGFGGRMGRAILCSCSRIVLSDGTPATLVLATERAGPRLSITEQARRLLAGCDEPIALFTPDGALLAATPAAQTRLSRAITLNALGAEPLGGQALAAGRASGPSKAGAIALDRLGADPAVVLMATFADAATRPSVPAAPPKMPETSKAAPPPEAPKATATGPEPAKEPTEKPASASAPPPSPPPIPSPPLAPHPPAARQQTADRPLRFVWQMDADSRFTLESAEFAALIGTRAAGVLGRPWSDIAAALELDPDGQIARAVASHETWSGITVSFPVEGADRRLAVEMAGLPVFDRERNFRGYRGYGICRDAALIAHSARRRTADAPTTVPRAEPPVFRDERPSLAVVPPSENVVPFRSSAPPEKPPSLTPVERSAFRELASRLTARLRGGERQEPEGIDAAKESANEAAKEAAQPEPQPPDIQRTAEPRDTARGLSGDHRPILDRLPVGVLVYRLDKLIYANRAFLDWTGYANLGALEEAGGLDALFVEPSGNGPTENNGAKSLTIATNRGDQLPVAARLFTSPWEGEAALVLMLASVGGAGADGRLQSLEDALQIARGEASELRSILDSASDGVVLLDSDGRVTSINHSAEMLFGYQSRELAGLPFVGLFAAASQSVALDHLREITRADNSGVASEGREIAGRGREGDTIPLFMTMGRLADGAKKICAVFRDISAWKKSEQELLDAKQRAEQASSAKSDFLAKISHEIRTPLNAIIGFSEVMMEERFGPVGNERYRQYLRDIHASGGHLIALLNDLLDLSKIEAGKLELNFTNVDLNVLTQQCVALMQPQANRERVIIRTALTQTLPPALADARSVRQIVLNLLSNSIKFTGTGGQVIVSTAHNEAGEVVLRVRDTGIGMSEQDIAVALEPFRQLATSARAGGTGLGLPLTKALAEANRASFSIRSARNAGTLVEIAFQGVPLAAE